MHLSGMHSARSLPLAISLISGAALLLGTALPLGATHTPAFPGAMSGAFASSPAASADTVIYVVAEEGNQARYRVREQLARLDFPNDAVGVTTAIQGRVMVTESGEVVREASRFVIGLTGLESDSDRRDNFLRRNTLGTDEHPDAIFVPTAIRGLPNPLPSSGEETLTLEGELTIRGVTRPVSWTVDAEFWEGAVFGQARTNFTFGDFELEVPSVGSVLSIRDDIRLEFDFRLVPED
jgi:polyisoprenoid-binding protein YceI